MPDADRIHYNAQMYRHGELRCNTPRSLIQRLLNIFTSWIKSDKVTLQSGSPGPQLGTPALDQNAKDTYFPTP